MTPSPSGEPPVVVSPSRGDVRQFPCKQCGAGLAFQPGTIQLTCPYCGHIEKVPTSAEEIREYDLNDALLTLPRQQGWGFEARAIRCENCGAATTFATAQVAGACAFCGSSKVIEEAAREDVVRPESLIPFQIDRPQAVQRFRDWLKRLWFRPSALKQSGQLAKIAGAYLPYWTFDAYTSSHWTAEAGYYYYETETYQERDDQGNMVTKTREVRRIRWEPVSGHHAEFFDDELICGSRGLPEKLLRAVCPYQLAALVGYDPAFLSGFMAEQYQVDLAEAWAAGKRSIEAKVYAACANEVPGDTHRNLEVATAFSQETFKHVLLPVWIAAYLYQSRAYRFLVNGQTGRVSGEAPLSWWKIAGAALLVILVILVIVFLTRR